MRETLITLFVILIPFTAFSQNDNCFGNSYEILQDFETSIDCPSEDWKLVFHDEFNEPVLDTALWYTYTPFTDGSDQCPFCRTHPNEGQIYLDENIQLSDGTVKLITKREDVSWMGETREFSSAKLHSKTSYRFHEGKFEIRCKVPFGKGFWPAFWLYRFGDEIDVFEIGGDNTDDYLASIHTEHGQVFLEHCRRSEDIPSGNLFNAFHTYSVEWEETEITWFLDGQAVFSIPKYTEAGLNGAERYCPDQLELGNYLESLFFSAFDMDLIANLAIPNENVTSLTSYPDELTVFPNQMEIDFIRVYQRIPKNNLVDLCKTFTFEGPSELCGSSETFQFMGPYDSVHWEVSDNLEIETAEGNQMTVKPIGYGPGFVQVSVDMDGEGPCLARSEMIHVQVASIFDRYFVQYQNEELIIFGNCEASLNDALTVRLFDTNGRLVMAKRVEHNVGQYRIHQKIETGIYLVHISGTDFEETIKVFVP